MKFYEFIKGKCSYDKVFIFVDMDGVLAEYRFERKRIMDNEKGYYLNSRPMETTLKILEKISELENVNLFILSLCNYKEQKDDKNVWLDKYASFIKVDNRIIIDKSSEIYEPGDKNKLKSRYISKICNNYDNVYLIDDDHSILNETKKQLETINIIHISSLID